MSRFARTALSLALAVAGLALGDSPPVGGGGAAAKPGAAPVVKRPDRPALTARTAHLAGSRLEVAGLDSAGPRDGKGDWRGRILICCRRDDRLCLFRAAVAAKMKQAAPARGREGPGRNLREAVRQAPALVEPLGRAVDITLLVVDEHGAVVDTRRGRVTELRLAR